MRQSPSVPTLYFGNVRGEYFGVESTGDGVQVSVRKAGEGGRLFYQAQRPGFEFRFLIAYTPLDAYRLLTDDRRPPGLAGVVADCSLGCSRDDQANFRAQVPAENGAGYEIWTGLGVLDWVHRHEPDVPLWTLTDGRARARWQGHAGYVTGLAIGADGATLITGLRSHAAFAASRLIVITSLDEADRAPYRFALEGVPVVHKTQVVTDLPPLLDQALADAPADAPTGAPAAWPSPTRPA